MMAEGDKKTTGVAETPQQETQPMATQQEQPAQTQPAQPTEQSQTPAPDSPKAEPEAPQLVPPKKQEVEVPDFSTPTPGRLQMYDTMRANAGMGYGDMENLINARRAKLAAAQESDADKKKREKRERARRIISAVGDGFAAINNVVAASHGSSDLYDPTSSMSEVTESAIAKARAGREKNRDAYDKVLERLAELKAKRGDAANKVEMQIAKDMADQAEQNRKQWLAKPEYEKLKAEAEKAGYDSVDAYYKALFAPEKYGKEVELSGAKIDTEKSKTAENYASADKNNAQATEARANTEGKIIPFMGKEYREKSEALYKAVDRYAKDFGIPVMTITPRTGQEKHRRPEDIMSDVEREHVKRQKRAAEAAKSKKSKVSIR